MLQHVELARVDHLGAGPDEGRIFARLLEEQRGALVAHHGLGCFSRCRHGVRDVRRELISVLTRVPHSAPRRHEHHRISGRDGAGARADDGAFQLLLAPAHVAQAQAPVEQVAERAERSEASAVAAGLARCGGAVVQADVRARDHQLLARGDGVPAAPDGSCAGSSWHNFEHEAFRAHAGEHVEQIHGGCGEQGEGADGHVSSLGNGWVKRRR